MTRHALDCGLHCGLAECDCGACIEETPRIDIERMQRALDSESFMMPPGLSAEAQRQYIIAAAKANEHASEPLPPTE